MIRKNALWFSLCSSLLFLGLACNSGDPNYSGNFESKINVTGNYRVVSTPNKQINNVTLTQSGNLVQGVDNRGTVYEGNATGDLNSLNVAQSTTQYVTVALTIQGTDGNGVTYTLLLTQAALQFIVPEGVTNFLVNTPQPNLQTNASNPVAVIGLVGTYTDSNGVSGGFEMHNNTIQTDESLPLP